MDELERLWPDTDRRDAALLRLTARIDSVQLTAAEVRLLQALSSGLTEAQAAHVLGRSVAAVHDEATRARRVLGAKNVTHACCEALRRGLIT